MYPALAVLQALHNPPGSGPSLLKDVLWVGGAGGMEQELVGKAGVPFKTVPAAGVHGVGIRALPGNLTRLARGFFHARAILRQYKPDVMFFTGGYVAVPVALAGLRIPSVLYVPDIEPGLALKTLARFTDHILVTAEQSRVFFPPRKTTIVTGYPTRKDLLDWKRAAAREQFDLHPEKITLLVFGGSKGARSINQALLAALPDLLPEIQVIHLTGSLDWPDIQAAESKLAAEERKHYRAYPYLHEDMGAALRSADLVLSRAGASTLGEFPLFELPAVLVPYPHAWRYQKVNARYLADQGAALILPDDSLPDKLADTVLDLVHNPQQLEEMKEAMRGLAHPRAAEMIAGILVECAGKPAGENCL